jgi:hypothetical protein
MTAPKAIGSDNFLERGNGSVWTYIMHPHFDLVRPVFFGSCLKRSKGLKYIWWIIICSYGMSMSITSFLHKKRF